MLALPRSRPLSVALTGAALLAAGTAAAGSLRVAVIDRDGAPVPEVAVWAKAVGDAASRTNPRGRSRMNQRDLAFEPHVLVVETGTAIDFPNEDEVRHHVYSFSPARKLNLSVDSGDVHESLVFDTPGVVTLGCNIHDEMLAYILVVDTPSFAKTDGRGVAVLSDLAPGRYEIEIWTPRLAGNNLPGPLQVAIEAGVPLGIEHRFEDKLFPPHRHSETSLHWSHY